MEPPEILTQRLMLSRLTESDASAMFAYRSQPEVCRYQFFEPGSLGDVVALIKILRDVEFGAAGSWYQFAIRLSGSGTLVGDIGAHFMQDDPRQVEIGFNVAPVHQGWGIGTEAVTGLIDYLLTTVGVHRVFASVDPRNKPSVALLERVGMRQEAHFQKSLWFKGEWVDDLVFATLRTEWERRHR